MNKKKNFANFNKNKQLQSSEDIKVVLYLEVPKLIACTKNL